MAIVKKVYVASTLFKNFTSTLKTDLVKKGFLDIQVDELTATGFIGFGTTRLTEESLAKIPDVEILLADPDIIGQVFKHPRSKLKWAQATIAGVDLFFKNIQDVQKVPKFIMTRRSDSFGRMISEFVIGRVIFRERGFDQIHDDQKTCTFSKTNMAIHQFRCLDEVVLGIIGLGQIGKEVAQACSAMGMTVWAALRDQRYDATSTKNYPGVDHLRPMSRLDEMLKACDYVVSILPNAPHTTNLLSGDVLKACQEKKSVFVNVGRGNVIDDDSLINALRNGWLGGAILDVFNKEPLSPSSLLWTLPGVTISPHVSATAMAGNVTSTAIFLENLQLYLQDKPLQLVVDFDKGY